MSLESEFNEAAARALGLPTQPNDVLLELYGLYKQAMVGDVTSDEPGMFDFVGRAKHDAWKQRKGMSKEEAMQAYVDRVAALSALSG